MPVTISDKNVEWLMRTISDLNKKVDKLIKKEHGLSVVKNPKWVKAKAIMSITGWDAEEMRIARERNYIEYREVKPKVIEYNIESLSEHFIKRKAS